MHQKIQEKLLSEITPLITALITDGIAQGIGQTDYPEEVSWFPWTERDDIQSLARLLLYSDVIDIEGIIACTSCFLKKGARRKDLQIIQNVIDAYEKVYHNLCIHSQTYPDADYLRSCSCCGIPAFGKEEGKGFAQDIYRDNEGVRRIISAVDKRGRFQL